MAKKKELEVKEYNADEQIPVAVQLNNVAYTLIQKGENFQVVKFNYDAETRTMGDLEVVSEHANQFDAGDELVLVMEEEIYS